jgi:hypothetical protein
MLRRVVVVAAGIIAAAIPTADAAAAIRLPMHWPRTLTLGLADPPGDAAALAHHTAVAFRYQYLAGGVNTGAGWSTWNPDGSFASMYVRESARTHLTSVFSYYMLQQSHPGAGLAEDAAIRLNLQTTATMRAFYDDLTLLFRRVGALRPTRVVVQIEPDMWGYIEQQSRADNAASVPARVASTGLGVLRGLPDTAAGVAQAVVRLRDRYAPNVLLGVHLSIWGTGTAIEIGRPSLRVIDQLAARSARFYRSLHARFDLVFTDIADRDADFNRLVRGDHGRSWWRAADFANFTRYAAGLSRRTRLGLVVWQIPLGNTIMRSVNDTWGHYADNRVQMLLAADAAARSRLAAWRNAGVIALLFGGGAPGTTCACDAQHDGVTNPAPIGQNTRPAISADDDGGYFAERARAYARHPLALGH